MERLEDAALAPLIRRVNPDSFSEDAHRPGLHIAYDPSDRQIVRPKKRSFFWFGKSKPVTHYFLKYRDKPLVLTEVTFHWTEGTSRVSLDFVATFQLHPEGQEEACRLSSALHHPNGPARALYNLIDKHLHRQMTLRYDDARNKDSDLLGPFYQDRTTGESRDLNMQVSEAVRNELGLSNDGFRIGFRIADFPCRRIEVDHRSEFRLSDASVARQVKTTAKLQMNNFQRFRNAGLTTKEDVERSVGGFIDDAVANHLFGKQFFELISQFHPNATLPEKDSIHNKIKSDIQRRAAGIGYEVDLFQTLPNIPPLRLIDGLRVDISSSDYEFKTKNSSGKVKLNIALEVKVGNFSKLRHLVQPEDDNVERLIQKEIAQICRDEIQKIDRQQFNLHFEEDVQNKLATAFSTKLRDGYGLEVSIISIAQEQTEDGERFNALLRKATRLTLEISPQADLGRKDYLRYSLDFEVVGMAEHASAWSAFESKDFGFRRDSHERTPKRRKGLQDELGDVTSDELEREWKYRCVQGELDAMADRIKATLEEYFSKIGDVANRTRSLSQSQEFLDVAQKLANDCISQEFGLCVELRSPRRLDTLTDQLGQEERTYGADIKTALRQSDKLKLQSQLSERASQLQAFHEHRYEEIKSGEFDPEEIEKLMDDRRTGVDAVIDRATKCFEQEEKLNRLSLLSDEEATVRLPSREEG